MESETEARQGENGPLGTALSAFGAVVLFASLFLDWFGTPGISAWSAFEVWDLVLAVLAVMALVDALAREGWEMGIRQREHGGLMAGLACTVIVLFNLINHPPAATGMGADAGIWLALASSLSILAGAVLRTARISVAFEIADRSSPAGSAARRPTPAEPVPAEPAPVPGNAAVEPALDGSTRATGLSRNPPEPYDPDATLPLGHGETRAEPPGGV